MKTKTEMPDKIWAVENDDENVPCGYVAENMNGYFSEPSTLYIRADLASAGEPGLEELLAMVPEGWHWVLRGGHPDDAPGECTFLMDNSENEAEYKRGHGPTPTAAIKNAMGVENG